MQSSEVAAFFMASSMSAFNCSFHAEPLLPAIPYKFCSAFLLERWHKIWTFEPEYGTMHIAILGFFLVIEGGVYMVKDLKGRDLGVGIYQRQDGLYSARYANTLGKRKVF